MTSAPCFRPPVLELTPASSSNREEKTKLHTAAAAPVAIMLKQINLWAVLSVSAAHFKQVPVPARFLSNLTPNGTLAITNQQQPNFDPLIQKGY